jgi:hypothetical protein
MTNADELREERDALQNRVYDLEFQMEGLRLVNRKNNEFLIGMIRKVVESEGDGHYEAIGEMRQYVRMLNETM